MSERRDSLRYLKISSDLKRWKIKGELILNCNCTVFCQCVVSLGKHPPTEGSCQAWLTPHVSQLSSTFSCCPPGYGVRAGPPQAEKPILKHGTGCRASRPVTPMYGI